MAEFYLIGECIECDSAELSVRKQTLNSVVDHPVLGKLTKYKSEKDSTAEIVRESTPKVNRFHPKANLNLRDTLKSKKLVIMVGKGRLKFKYSSNHSATHGTQHCTTGCFTYAEITEPFKHISDAVFKRIEQSQKKLRD